MTLATMRTVVLQRLDEDPTNPATFTTAEATAALNEAQMLFVLLTLCLEKSAPWTLANATPFSDILAVFTDWILPLRITVAGAKVRPARLTDLDALNSNWQAATGPAVTRYAQLGFSLLVAYPPVGGTLQVVYACAPAPLVNDADVPAIPVLYHQALVDYATYRLREKQGGSEFQDAIKHLSDFLEAAKKMGAFVRARSLAQRYDKLPIELERIDLSRLLKLRKDLLPKAKPSDAA